ncbi:MAG: helix-turn-helix domain-containing protein [Lachnospiraceae bacterium]|nr:helix-turn-helix domain-containing protein [Lachnospiraceae bacterium]
MNKQMDWTDVAAAIPFGIENTVSRGNLKRRLGLSDRTVRKYIEKARENGVIIINLQNSEGYFKADETDLNNIARQFNQNENRAMSILVQQKFLRRILAKAGRMDGKKAIVLEEEEDIGNRIADEIIEKCF